MALDGKVFCVTGTFELDRKGMAALISDNGGRVVTAMSKNVTHLVASSGESGTAKYNKAEELGTAIIDLDELRDLIGAKSKGKAKAKTPAAKAKAPVKPAPKAKTPASRKRKAESSDDESDEESESEEKVVKKPAAKRSRTAPAKAKAAGGGSKVFDGEVFVISGKFDVPRADLEESIVDAGGRCVGAMSGKVTILLTTVEAAGTAKNKASSSVRVMYKPEFDKVLGGSGSAGSAGSGGGDDDDDVDDDDESESEEAPKAKGKAKKAAPAKAAPAKSKAKAKAKAVASESESESDESDEPVAPAPQAKKKVIVKGRTALDERVTGEAAKGHVLDEGGDAVWSCMLNQTNIAQNNNKFYVVQVIESDAAPHKYWCHTRWGRVGEPGQCATKPCPNASAATLEFCKKYKEKTGSLWSDRANFQAKPGLYTLIEITFDEDEEPKAVSKDKATEKKKAPSVERQGSKLDLRVQRFISLICDVKMMETAMRECDFDVNKMPLGKLSKSQILKGYELLKQIEAELLSANVSKTNLLNLTNRFFTAVPHSFGRKVAPVINTTELLRHFTKSIDTLADIEIAVTLMDDEGAKASCVHPIDQHFERLKCDLEPVDNGSDEFEMINKYIKNTYDSTTKPKIVQAFRMQRHGEEERFKPAKETVGNRKLLWHGSRLTNYVGIISQGLRIAPPEAPVSGYRFGKGAYFADMCSLSAMYCRSGNDDFCMLLGDVALGKTYDVKRDEYMEKAKPGFGSTLALGGRAPDPKELGDCDGATVPFGPVIDTGISSACRENQYIVYDVNLVRLRYVIHMSAH